MAVCCLRAIPVIAGGTFKDSAAVKHVMKYHRTIIAQSDDSDKDEDHVHKPIWPPPHGTCKLDPKRSFNLLSYLRMFAASVKPTED